MKITPENIDELLAKYFAEEGEHSEKESVDEWVASDKANLDLFEKSEKVWDLSKQLKSERTVDVDAGWMKLKCCLSDKKEPDNEGVVMEDKQPQIISLERKRNVFPLFRIAAGILLVLGMGLAAYYFTRPQLTEQLTFATKNTSGEKILPDGTVIFLNKNSLISYPASFDGDIREVKLTGEAFFNVKRDEKHPFIIKANGTEIKVLGTSFNVKAYSSNVEVVVESGKVQFSKNTQKVLLIKGDKAVVTEGKDLIEKSENTDENILTYKTQKLIFEKTSLEQVALTLTEVYGVPVTLSPNLKNCKLTATFEKEKFESILDVIAETLTLSIDKKDNQIYLDGKGCE